MNKQDKKAKQSPETKLLNKLRAEQKQIQNNWRSTNAQLNEAREEVEQLQKQLSVLEGQSSAIRRNMNYIVSTFDMKPEQMPEGLSVRKIESSKKEKKKKGDK